MITLILLEFIARLILHIPDIHERRVLYYGAANTSKLRAVVRAGWDPTAAARADSSQRPDLEPSTPFGQRRRIRWARLIRRIWLEDPLLCPECPGRAGRNPSERVSGIVGIRIYARDFETFRP